MFSSARQGRHQVERLEHEADLVPAEPGELLRRPACVSSVVADEDLARGGGVEGGQAVHERRLAGARRAHDGGEPLSAELDGHPVEGDHLGVARAVDLGQHTARAAAVDRSAEGVGVVGVVTWAPRSNVVTTRRYGLVGRDRSPTGPVVHVGRRDDPPGRLLREEETP